MKKKKKGTKHWADWTETLCYCYHIRTWIARDYSCGPRPLYCLWPLLTEVSRQLWHLTCAGEKNLSNHTHKHGRKYRLRAVSLLLEILWASAIICEDARGSKTRAASCEGTSKGEQRDPSFIQHFWSPVTVCQLASSAHFLKLFLVTSVFTGIDRSD